MAKIYCAQCKINAEDDFDIGPELATVYVQGRRPSYNDPDRMVPYRANLCDDHCELELADGADFQVQRRIIQ